MRRPKLCKAGCREFKPFRRLPLELRLMVWKLSIPGPRIVKIISSNVWRPKFNGGPFPGYFPVKPKGYCVPGMFHACSESREVCRKFYEVAFGDRMYGRPIFFDFSTDILYFDGPKALFSFYKGFGQDVVNDEGCARDIVDFEKKLKFVIMGGDINWIQALETLKRLGSLQTLILEGGVTFDITRAEVQSLLKGAWKIGKDDAFKGPKLSWISSENLDLKFKAEKNGMPIWKNKKTIKAARPNISRRSARIRCQVRKLCRAKGRKR